MTTNSTATDNSAEVLLQEQARALIRDLLLTGDQSKDGEVLANLETFLLHRGREFLRNAFQVAAEAQAAAVEKKVRRRGPVPAAVAATTRGDQPAMC
jgi:hypothetical protein